jgi:ketosteroid isomerase-like protein
MEKDTRMNSEQQNFEHFMKRRSAAALAYVSGDAAPLSEIASRQSPATFFPPSGGHHQGAEAVWSEYERGATNFEPGAEGGFEILHMAASDGLAYWTGFQHATTHLRGRAEPVEFHLRITELYRREGEDWKLIHRHADPLISAPNAR